MSAKTFFVNFLTSQNKGVSSSYYFYKNISIITLFNISINWKKVQKKNNFNTYMSVSLITFIIVKKKQEKKCLKICIPMKISHNSFLLRHFFLFYFNRILKSDWIRILWYLKYLFIMTWNRKLFIKFSSIPLKIILQFSIFEQLYPTNAKEYLICPGHKIKDGISL